MGPNTMDHSQKNERNGQHNSYCDTVTKPATNLRDADATPRVNIMDFFEEYYEDILPINMGKSVFDQLSETYSPSITKSRPGRTNSRDHPRSRSRPYRLDASNEGCPKNREYFCDVGESYDDSYSRSYHDRDHPHHMKRKRDNESPLSSVSKSDSSDGRRIKGAPECMRISRFMHGVNNLELKKCLNEYVPKKIEEMMITTTAFIRGEVIATSKKKGRGSSRFTPLTRKPKEILTAEVGKFQPPPPMVTPVEKRNNNKFCDFHNDKGHSTDEWKKEPTAKDKLAAIYVIQSWQRMTRQKVTQSFERVREISFPPLTTSSRAEGPLVIEAKIGGHMIHRMYVDEGSSMEILYENCFNRLRPEVKNQMVPTTTSLTSFSGETIWLLAQLRLLVTIGDADHFKREWMNFMIVRSLSPYNGIIVRPGIKEIQAVPSTAYGMLKFQVDKGIVTVRSTILIPAECAMEVAIEGTLSTKGRTKLCLLLKEKLDIFAWHPSDMTGVPRLVVEHRLNIQEGYSPVWQKKRGQASECAKAIQAESKEARRQLVNVRQFHGFKQGLSAGLLPLPEIDWKVESLNSYPFKCFLDIYKGYHQIQLAESDEEKMAFHTGQGVYCYTKMPFGLKNAGTTYQRLVDKAFVSQIGRNIEVYVDDLIVKSHTEAEMLRDIGETFRTLRKINMKLNPKKYTFGAVEGVFLGYMVNPEGIKPSRDKTTVVLRLPFPRIIKEVQILNGKLASLNRFLSKSAEKSLALFKTLKKCIKKTPKPKEELIVYMFTSYGAISAVLMTERGTVPMPIYFISRTLQGPELNYTPMEKLVLSLVFAAKILRRTTKKIERHDGRTQYHVSAKDVGERTASNNESEYEALIAGLRIAMQMGVQNVHVSVDSKLVANQVLGTYVSKEENMHARGTTVSGGQSHRIRILLANDASGRVRYDTGHTAKIGMPTYRTAEVDIVYNDEELRLNLDLLEE
nr:hypothetical protein [Tanacetum cinerariifolium]